MNFAHVKACVVCVWLVLMIDISAFGQAASILELTLQDAIDRALIVSRDTAKAQIDVKIDTTTKLQNFATMSPKLATAVRLTNFDREVAIGNFQDANGPPIVIRPLTLSTATVTMSQPITGLIAAIQKAKADATKQRMSELAFEEMRASVTFAVAQAYRHVQQTEALYFIAQERVAVAETQRRDAEAIVKVGRKAKSDVLQLEVAVNQAKVEVAIAKATADITRAQFLDTLNYDVASPIMLEKMPDASQINVALNVPELDVAQKIALSYRRDLKIAKLGTTWAHQNSYLPLAALLPDVKFFVSWETYIGATAGFSNASTQSLGFSVDWNIWDGGASFLGFRKSRLELYKSKIRMIDVERSVTLDLLQRRADLVAAIDTLALQKSSLIQAEEAYRGVSERFRLGTISVTELLQTEETLNKTRVDLAKAVTELDVKNMLLEKSLGKTRPTSIL